MGGRKDMEDRQTNNMHKTLRPLHIWGLGVGIVLVGEFMGWNFAVAKGGSLGALVACWLVGILYISLVLVNSEMGCEIKESGGQYAMAKRLMGPTCAYNVGLMLVFQYTMLAAADLMVIGELLKILKPGLNILPVIVGILLLLAILNYRGAELTLKINFVITALAITAIFVLLFSTKFYSPEMSIIRFDELTNGFPYGFMGVVAAMQFAIWFFLGIEGTVLASEECRSTKRSIPVGSVLGVVTLIIGATTTWFICSSLLPVDVLSVSIYPLFAAAQATGRQVVISIMFMATILACLASANGCIHDACRAWYSMSCDGLVSEVFAKLHPKYKTQYRAILFLLPIPLVFGMTGLLDQVITFSILSALLLYILTAVMMIKFRKNSLQGADGKGYKSFLHPYLSILILLLTCMTLFGMYMGYWVNLLMGCVFYLLATLWFVKLRKNKLEN
jgi:ethanolamine permease